MAVRLFILKIVGEKDMKLQDKLIEWKDENDEVIFNRAREWSNGHIGLGISRWYFEQRFGLCGTLNKDNIRDFVNDALNSTGDFSPVVLQN